MRTILAVYKRELKAAFQNPGVYVVAGGFYFLVSSLTMYAIMDYSRQSAMALASPDDAIDFTQTMSAAAFGTVSLLFVFIIPIITMRSFAEEKRSGAFELLVTWPIRDWELILGKFLSLTSVVWIMVSLMLSYVVVFHYLAPPDTWVFVSAFLGLGLLSMAYVAFGLFASALTENQIIAAILTFAGLFMFYIIQNLGGDGTTLFSRVCDAVSLSTHFSKFVQGAIEAIDLVYYPLFTAFWLFMTARALESRNWTT